MVQYLGEVRRDVERHGASAAAEVQQPPPFRF